MLNNIFFKGLSGDWRGWKYDPTCQCIRCKEFLLAAFYIINMEIGEESFNVVEKTNDGKESFSISG